MLLDQSRPTSEIEWLCVDVDGYKIVNVYKPPPTRLRTLDLPVFPHPCLYAGDFNCCHADWGYDGNSPDGECLADWASINCLALLYNAKDAASFYSGRWNTGTNPDLAFACVGPNSRLPDRRILEKFPRSQHRFSLITPPRFAMAVPSMPVKRWNFCKANWSHYIALTNKFAKTLLPPDSLDVDAAYQDFCNITKKAAKKTISCGCQNNYIPCWDAECESFYKTFLQSPQGDDSSLAATALLAKLDRKRRDRWSKAVRSIDFSHSSRKAWSILNNLTGRSRHSPRHCPVSADAIASQLVRNGKYEAVDRKSSRLVFQKVSDLWRATTPDAVNISDNFSQREFAAALQHLKPDKAPGPDSICPKLILHVGAALKSRLRDFLSSCLHRLKIPKIWRRALVVAIPKPRRFCMTKLDAGLITPLPASDSGSATVWGSKRINPRPQSCLCLALGGCPSNNNNNLPLNALSALNFIFNQSLSHGKFISTFKHAKIIPIYKKRNPKNATIYLAISLLSNISKILDKIVYNCLFFS